MKDLFERCPELLAEAAPPLPVITRALRDVRPCELELAAALRPDPGRPYGRRVFLGTQAVEGMLATWTPGASCAPHDHGGSSGGVRVLRGVAIHRIYRVIDGALTLIAQERAAAGEVLVFGAGLIHSMGDGGGEASLVTLHLYAGPIPHMVVYDLERGETLKVDGGCGAWVPDDPAQILGRWPGFVSPCTILASGAASAVGLGLDGES
jgi:hypothetical protein